MCALLWWSSAHFEGLPCETNFSYLLISRIISFSNHMNYHIKTHFFTSFINQYFSINSVWRYCWSQCPIKTADMHELYWYSQKQSKSFQKTIHLLLFTSPFIYLYILFQYPSIILNPSNTQHLLFLFNIFMFSLRISSSYWLSAYHLRPTEVESKIKLCPFQLLNPFMIQWSVHCKDISFFL